MFLSFEYRSVNLMKINRQIICSFIFVVFLVMVTGTALASDVNVELANRLGPMNDVDVVGNYAYVGEGSEFLIFDISNPSSPVQLSRTTAKTNIIHLDVSGNYAYIVEGYYGLEIIDISNPY